jgi:nitroreductase
MKVSEALASRRSVRGFLPTPVTKAVIGDILTKAARAPSGGNLQPWHVVALAGAPLAALKTEMASKTLGQEKPEYAVYPTGLPDPYETRRVAVGEAMYGLMGITRENRPARRAWFARNFQLFGAPLGLFFHTPRLMGPPQWSDLGMYLQSIMLLLREEGLDSCPQEAWSAFPDTVRRHLLIPNDHIFFCGMAVGYPDPDEPANALITTRAPLSETARFMGL